MSCEICGRSSCSKSFHSIDEQQEFDIQADDIKDRMGISLAYKINRLDCIEDNEKYYVSLDEVIEIIESYS